MSEYICNTEDKCGMCEAYRTAEPIVRCRDCKEFAFGNDEYATADWCDYWNAYVESQDGFCAWAKRREP